MRDNCRGKAALSGGAGIAIGAAATLGLQALLSGPPGWAWQIISRVRIDLNKPSAHVGPMELRYWGSSVNANGEPFSIYLAVIPGSGVWAHAYITVLQRVSGTEWVVAIDSLTSSEMTVFYDDIEKFRVSGRVGNAILLS